MPRWFIFCLDLVVVTCAIILAYVLRFNFGFQVLSYPNVQISVLVVLVGNAIAFLAFRNHIGIIRYTAMSDTLRLLQITTITSVVFGIAGRLIGRSFHLFLPVSVVAINFALSFFLLFGYRLLVRATLQKNAYMRGRVRFAKKAAIYGADQEAIVAGQVFRDSPRPAFRIVAFVDANKANMRLLGMPVLPPDEKALKALVAQEVDSLLIPDHQSGGKELRDFLDLAFRCGIRKVRKLPPVQRWMDGKLEDDQLKEIRIEDLLERAPIQINNKKIADSITGKRVLVTGAAGSIGSELVRQLARLKPSSLILVDTAESPLHELMLELEDLKLTDCPIYPMIGDITDSSRIDYVFNEHNPQMVFHAAAYKHVPLMEENPSIAVLNNVLGTRNLVELSVANNVETFVLVSTDKAVNPTNVMGASKRIAEIYMQSFAQEAARTQGRERNTKFITTRFGNVLGSNGSVIPRFKNQLASGGPLTVTHPDINRFFMTIAEACQLVIEAGVMGEGGEIFVFDMGEPVKIVDLAERMIRLSGKEPGRDIQITFTGLRPGEKLYEEVLATSEETMTTYNKKIMIAKVRSYKMEEITPLIEDLIHSAQLHHVTETVQLMKQIVPEFISKNSQFEKLDVLAKKARAADEAEDLHPSFISLNPYMPSPQIMQTVRPQAVAWRAPERELVSVAPPPQIREAPAYIPQVRKYAEDIPKIVSVPIIEAPAHEEERNEIPAPKPYVPVAEARKSINTPEAPTLEEYIASLEEGTADVSQEEEAFWRPESPLLKARPLVGGYAQTQEEMAEETSQPVAAVTQTKAPVEASLPARQPEAVPEKAFTTPSTPFLTTAVKQEAMPPVPPVPPVSETSKMPEEVYFNGYQNGSVSARMKLEEAVREDKQTPAAPPNTPAVETSAPSLPPVQKQPAMPLERTQSAAPAEKANPAPMRMDNPFMRIERDESPLPAPEPKPAPVEMQRPQTPSETEKPAEKTSPVSPLNQFARDQWMTLPGAFEEVPAAASNGQQEPVYPPLPAFGQDETAMPERPMQDAFAAHVEELEQSAFEETPLSEELTELSNLAESLSQEEEEARTSDKIVEREAGIPDVRREMPQPQPAPQTIRTDEIIAAEEDALSEPKRFQPPVYQPTAIPPRMTPLPTMPEPRQRPSYTPPVREHRSTGWPRGTR